MLWTIVKGSLLLSCQSGWLQKKSRSQILEAGLSSQLNHCLSVVGLKAERFYVLIQPILTEPFEKSIKTQSLWAFGELWRRRFAY